jgi:hypothetical protein
VLAGSPAAFDSQGLQHPAIDPIMLFASMAAPALTGMADMAPQAMASEAGAIFPEGMAMPKDRSLIKEFGDILPESQKIYRQNEALANWHASNMDFPAVLRDKWALLKNTAGAY